MALNKKEFDEKQKYFVQGQVINTGITVDNLDDNAKERLVGQVYHPKTGEIVPGAEAYIDDNGVVQVKLPDGAVDKDGNINEDSIFYKDAGFKAIHQLDVKFFARPRKAEEFQAIAEANYGIYTGTEAGEDTINHKGQSVVIDKQGIDRYDHYNLIGDFKLNLDDTKYYDQHFKDGEGNDKVNDIADYKVQPNTPFEVEIYKPASPEEYDKTAEDMNEAKAKGQAAGVLDYKYIDRINEGKAEKDKWKVDVDADDISKFTITPPQSAKAGDSVIIPIRYTYTNGSTDTHFFEFVV